jgi:hemerythrin-like domain-containing protein
MTRASFFRSQPPETVAWFDAATANFVGGDCADLSWHVACGPLVREDSTNEMETTVPTTKRKTTATRRAKADSTDAIDILLNDHREVEKMFKAFEKLRKGNGDNESKRELVDRACAALTVHTQIEEEIFYPATRGVLRDAELGEEALVEHGSVKELIAKLEKLQPGEELYDATFTVIAEYVKHHVQEEEKKMFPQIRRGELDLDALGAEMKQRKDELEDENGPIEAAFEDTETTSMGRESGQAHRRTAH